MTGKDYNAVSSANERAAVLPASISMRDEFQKWLADGNARKYPPEVVSSCMDRVSEYASRKKISAGSLWEYEHPSAFSPIYNRLLEAKLLRITDRKTHKVFITAGQLYLRFLKEKPFTDNEAAAAVSAGQEEKFALKPIQATNSTIDPEDVVAWLITQPNANGTLYLENVVRQYMGALRTAPAKLKISVNLADRNVFSYHTPEELTANWKIFKAAPNYKQVNSSTSGAFSAALNCYMRYLQHLAVKNQAGRQEDESMKLSGTHLIQNKLSIKDKLYVDLKNPEQYKNTIPVSCVINGAPIKIHKKPSWEKLLAAITAKFISENNPAINELRTKPLYSQTPNGQKTSAVPFLSSRKIYDQSIWVEYMYSGGWINVGFSVPTIIRIIQLLCERCGVDSNNVLIESVYQNEITVDDVFVTRILSDRFSNGYRLNSPIEMARFRSFAAEDLGKQLTLSDEELKACIAACGTNYEGKIYSVSTETKGRIKELAEDYFAEGAQVIFFAEFYAKNENRLFEASVVSEDMLIDILRRIFPKLSFTQTYFGHTDDPVSAVLESEILRIWGDDVLLTYEQLTERLQYIPLDRIKFALAQNGDFIWSSVETYSHVSQIEITDEEWEAIDAAAVRECNTHGYVSIKDLPFGEIEERNYELSVTAIHNAVYRICLSDKFDKKGKIVTRKGDVFDALTIMKEYCRTVDNCSLDDLLSFEKELTGESHRWIPMEAGNTTMVRIDKDTYVADRYVRFNADLVDEAIELAVKGNYLPLKSFTTFGAFPDCGQTWNLFLLESYCRRFSRKFRFDAPSVNSRNAGAVIRKSCVMDYTEIMADAVANADIPLKDTAVGKFLSDNGYTGRSTTAKAGEIIYKAKAIRERRD